jgi:hypothetical protein
MPQLAPVINALSALNTDLAFIEAGCGAKYANICHQDKWKHPGMSLSRSRVILFFCLHQGDRNDAFLALIPVVVVKGFEWIYLE